MTTIIYKEFYNKDRGLPEPMWGAKVSSDDNTVLQCPSCNSKDIYYTAHPDDPGEIFKDTVRCKACGRITDWYSAYKNGLHHDTNSVLIVVHNNIKKEVHMQAYCVRCRAKQDINYAKTIVMKNGRPAVQGNCAVCGTKVFRIGTG